MFKRKNQKEYEEYLKTLPKDYNFFTDHSKEHLVVEKYKYWGIIKNEYSYNVGRHNLLYPLKKVDKVGKLLSGEQEELFDLIDQARKTYDYILLNGESSASVNNHLHFHLIKVEEQCYRCGQLKKEIKKDNRTCSLGYAKYKKHLFK